MLPYLEAGRIEAGCDEAGRGCLAGPVSCAAVILPPDFRCDLIDDSKKLSERRRAMLRPLIEHEALAWAVVMVEPEEIDRINILQASITGMQRALDTLGITPEHILVDGNKFRPYRNIPYTTVVHGDATYLSIAAASILAKTHRDELMDRLSTEFPAYEWSRNKGYPTKAHKLAIISSGLTPYHRRSFSPDLTSPSLFDTL